MKTDNRMSMHIQFVYVDIKPLFCLAVILSYLQDKNIILLLNGYYMIVF